MKLQINTKGSWRNVVDYDVTRAPEVEDAAATLARALGTQNFRVLDDGGNAYWLTEHGTFRKLHESEAP